MGNALIQAGDYGAAEVSFGEALTVAKAADLLPVVMEALLGFATLRSHAGLHKEALALSLHILRQPVSLPVTRAGSERVHRIAVAHLTAAQITLIDVQEQNKPVAAIARQRLTMSA